MVSESVSRRVETLYREFQFHNYRYDVLDAPLITDAEYYALLRELWEIDGRSPKLRTRVAPIDLPQPQRGDPRRSAVRGLGHCSTRRSVLQRGAGVHGINSSGAMVSWQRTAQSAKASECLFAGLRGSSPRRFNHYSKRQPLWGRSSKKHS